MSTISSRTPDGEPVRCPVCGHLFAALPSQPLMDTTCPNCGCLLVIERKDDIVEVTGVIVAGNRPIVRSEILPEHEPVENISDLTPGKMVRIAHGTFEGFVARITSVDASSGTANIEITIFGRISTFDVKLTDIVGDS